MMFTALSVVYYLFNIIFPTDYAVDADNAHRIYPKLAAGLLTLLSMWIVVRGIKTLLRNKIMSLFLLLFVLALLYIFYPFNVRENFTFVLRVYTALITGPAIYLILLRIHDSRKSLPYIIIIYALQLIFCLSSLVSDSTVASTTATVMDSNSGFLLLMCIPMSLILPIKRIRIYIYAVLLIACLYSGQRSAALAAVVSFPFCLYFLKSSIKKKDIYILFLLGVFIVSPILIKALQNIHVRNQYDVDTEALGSGRLIFWAISIRDFFQHGLFSIVFGNGTNSVAKVIENQYGLSIGAHNGWIDMLYTFGFVGEFIYVLIFYTLLRNNKEVNRFLPSYKNLYLILLLIFVIKASTSHGYFDVSVMPFTMVISIVEARKEQYIRYSKMTSKTNT